DYCCQVWDRRTDHPIF
nr:immunoglobulin light chain junction region [Macaca mulatta]MOX69763.1 immunoglobulin light chain junction region [Macaca mulatta]MOX70114.1 immunoglobulin light chain junction region [Macaca mulatta]MOX70219.1 immunoglobulin light chain junction region [Macaca mulatta]MOX70494.1 immunoglobulin light chain junction region [Macaca mulatta]